MNTSEMIITYFRLSEQEKKKDLPVVVAEDLLRTGKFATGYAHIAILQDDGTVSAYGSDEFGQCDVAGWSRIIKLAAGDYYTLGLKDDGTVMAAGDNRYGQCNVSDWRDIRDIFAQKGLTIGVKTDNSLVFSCAETAAGDRTHQDEQTEPEQNDDDADEIRSEELQPTPAREFSYSKLYNRIYITKYRGTRKDIVIPSMIEGLFVRSINYRAFADLPVRTVILPDTLEVINADAFRNCQYIKSIRVPDNVDQIGDKAFMGCGNLKEVVLSKSLRKIGTLAFGDCFELKRVKIPLSAKNHVDSLSLNGAFDDPWAVDMIYI